MKKLLLLAALFAVITASAQTDPPFAQYTKISNGYNWLRGFFKALNLPSGPEPVLGTGQINWSGGIFVDTLDGDGTPSGVYVYKFGAWEPIGGGTTNYFALPLYLDGDTVRLNEASAIDDGYLSAGNFAKFDSLRNDWARVNTTRLYTANTTDSVFLGTTTPVTPHVLNLIGNIHFTGKVYTSTANRRAIDINSSTQNTFVGGRSGNETLSGTENAAFGELAGGSLTTGVNNTFFGKGAGFTVTTGNTNLFMGRNVHASGGTFTGTNNVALGANVPSVTADNQLNINNWLYGNNGLTAIGGTAASHTPTASFDIDSVAGYAHLRLREMAADPTTVNDGNVWHYNDHVYARLNGVTYQLDQQTGAVPTLQQVLTSGQTSTVSADFTNASISFTGTGYGLIFNNGGGNTTYLLSGATNAMRFVKTGGTIYTDLNNSLLSANRVQSFPDATGTFTLNDNTATITNKRITRRTTTIVSSATPTPDGDASDIFTVSALAAGAVFAAPTGTPTEGQGLIIRIVDNGGAQTLGWNAIYRAGTDITLPTTTVAGKFIYVGFLYNSASSTWDLVSKIDGF